MPLGEFLNTCMTFGPLSIFKTISHFVHQRHFIVRTYELICANLDEHSNQSNNDFNCFKAEILFTIVYNSNSNTMYLLLNNIQV